MKKRLTLACALSLGLIMVVGFSMLTHVKSQRRSRVQPQPHVHAHLDRRLASANNQFGMKLFQQIVQADPAQNVLISPYSLSTALTMTYNGAAGTTREAIGKVLGIDGMSLDRINEGSLALAGALSSKDPKIRFLTANSLWIREGFPVRPEFISRARKCYDAQVSGLQGAPDTINAWVSQHTEGRITNIVNDVSPGDLVFLVNATYFKGKWAVKFNKSLTRDGTFHIPGDKVKTVPMMWQSGEHEHYRGDGFEAVRLPYGSGGISMYIFLPNSDLRTFYKSLSAKNLDTWISCLRKESLEVSIPRFKVEWSRLLNNQLIALGMGEAFGSGGHPANFTGMTSNEVDISEVIHKSFMQMDEEGTTAAAATAVIVAKGPGDPFVPTMIVNHPFFCVIRDDRSGEILFMANVTDPE